MAKKSGHVQPPVPLDKRYVVLSVRLTTAEFEQIALYAERNGKKTSTFVKEAALKRSSPGVEITRIQSLYPVAITATNLKAD
jgi:hypothetical protein